MGGASPQTARCCDAMKLLLVTYSRNERYVDLCTSVLDELWPLHPEIVVCSDRGGFRYGNRIIVQHPDWVPMMHGCLSLLLESGRLALDEHVLLILEDHIPNAAINGVHIQALSDFLRAHGDAYLLLGGYGCSAE